MAIILHAIFGLVAMAGSIGMSVRYAAEKENLSTAMKTGMIMTYIGSIVSSILGFASATNNNPIVVGGLIVATVIYSVAAYLKPAKKQSNN